MDKAGTLPIILYENAQKATNLTWGTELEMEGLHLVAANDNEVPSLWLLDKGSEMESNETENNEHDGNVQEEDDAI